MKLLLAAASLLLASVCSPAQAHPTPAPPLQERGVATAEVSRTAPADLPPAVAQAYFYLVNIVGIDPCDALKEVLGYPSATAPQQYAHERLQAIGYDFPTPDPADTFTCPQ